MQITELQKTMLGGYRKESVYQYIAALNEEFSGKLMEKDAKYEEALIELKTRNKLLEEELSAVKKEKELLQKLQSAVSDSIISAQTYAAQLREETAQKEEKLRQKLETEMAQSHERIDDYSSQIEEFRVHLKSLLEDIGKSLETAQDDAAALQAKCPVLEFIEPEPDNAEQASPTVMSMFKKKQLE